MNENEISPVAFAVTEDEMMRIKELLREAQIPQVTFSFDYETMRKEAEAIRGQNIDVVLGMLEKYGGK